ncbi:MAG: Na/Pi symporter [bacterium]
MEISQLSERHHFIKNLLLFIFFLYLFFLSIELMGSAFKGFGKDFAEKLISTTSNPFVGLFIGILSTSIAQSSSLTTSVVVGMVAAGTITIPNAIPFIMGANIGTTVTSLIVAMAHINRKQEFRKAFAGATVHDAFNVLSVIILMPLHLVSQHILGISFLEFLAMELSNTLEHVGGLKFTSPLKFIVEPISNLFYETLLPAILYPFGQLSVIFKSIIGLIFALLLLFFALTFMVKYMKSALLVKIENLFDTYIFKTALRSFLVGMFITATIQSSSVSVSLSVPLVAAGILTLDQVFPYILGANIGTTITAILASLVTGSKTAMTIAFVHLWFNVTGSLIWFPLRKIPILLANELADISTRSKKLAIAYLIVVFYIIPGLLILLTR